MRLRFFARQFNAKRNRKDAIMLHSLFATIKNKRGIDTGVNEYNVPLALHRRTGKIAIYSSETGNDPSPPLESIRKNCRFVCRQPAIRREESVCCTCFGVGMCGCWRLGTKNFVGFGNKKPFFWPGLDHMVFKFKIL